ncbi:MAG: NHL repeat-containing protein [Pseudomonadota bacterium]
MELSGMLFSPPSLKRFISIGIITYIASFFIYPVVVLVNAENLTKVDVVHIILDDYEGKRLSSPCRLFYDSYRREIYIVDCGNNRILIYMNDFFPLITIDRADGIESPLAVSVDAEGNLFVIQAGSEKHPNGRLSVLNACLKWQRDIQFKDFEGADSFSPRNLAHDRQGKLYVAGDGYEGVVVFNKDGNFSHLLNPTETVEEKKVKATINDVEIDDYGKIYLLSEENGRVYVYDGEENFLRKFGQKGGATGKMSRPKGISVDVAKALIYIIDYMRHTASAYSMEGEYLFEFAGMGWAPGWLNFPYDICTDREGHVLIADTFNNRVQVFKITPVRQ